MSTFIFLPSALAPLIYNLSIIGFGVVLGLFGFGMKGFATGAMIGAFQDSECAGKIQLGAPWWFLDSLSGMRRHYEALSSNGLFGRFVGMVTDSRSFLSYARHEYFRRALCSTIGSEMEAGRIPQDIELAGSLVRGVSYFNAKGYFNF